MSSCGPPPTESRNMEVQDEGLTIMQEEYVRRTISNTMAPRWATSLEILETVSKGKDVDGMDPYEVTFLVVHDIAPNKVITLVAFNELGHVRYDRDEGSWFYIYEQRYESMDEEVDIGIL